MKLQRAEEHLGQLVTEHQQFIHERNPYRMLREADPEPGYYVWRAKIVEPPPLEKWASIAGECVHALRSALDHTAFELVRRGDPTATYSEFPIFKDRFGDNSWDSHGKRKLRGVDRKVLAQAKWLQPYRRAQEHDPLWRVHRLDIIDKHRHLPLVSPYLRHSAYAPEGGTVEDVAQIAGPFEDGTPVARFKMVPYAGSTMMYVKTEFTFDISFGEGELLTNEPVMQSLENLRTYVGFVVARFDRFFN
jgi:hypothetical protein